MAYLGLVPGQCRMIRTGHFGHPALTAVFEHGSDVLSARCGESASCRLTWGADIRRLYVGAGIRRLRRGGTSFGKHSHTRGRATAHTSRSGDDVPRRPQDGHTLGEGGQAHVDSHAWRAPSLPGDRSPCTSWRHPATAGKRIRARHLFNLKASTTEVVGAFAFGELGWTTSPDQDTRPRHPQYEEVPRGRRQPA
jgi:hypothetical protein